MGPEESAAGGVLPVGVEVGAELGGDDEEHGDPGEEEGPHGELEGPPGEGLGERGGSVAVAAGEEEGLGPTIVDGHGGREGKGGRREEGRGGGGAGEAWRAEIKSPGAAAASEARVFPRPTRSSKQATTNLTTLRSSNLPHIADARQKVEEVRLCKCKCCPPWQQKNRGIEKWLVSGVTRTVPVSISDGPLRCEELKRRGYSF